MRGPLASAYGGVSRLFPLSSLGALPWYCGGSSGDDRGGAELIVDDNVDNVDNIDDVDDDDVDDVDDINDHDVDSCPRDGPN
mmetsp:Transcript_93745/g.262243  ORF Transcript_93745/g.262243 Transcript_93745/m.262243 type:complete len:82 (-) Transcript_93745:439-684(-)